MSTEQVTRPRHAATGPGAAFWPRLAAALLDALLISLASAGPALAIGPEWYYAVVAVLSSLYFTALEGRSAGQTLGKRLFGLRVTGLADGAPIGPRRAFVRHLGRLPSGLALMLGFLWMLRDPHRQTWHDKWAGAVVVPSRPPAEG